MKVIDEFAGVLPFTDKATPEVISREMSMSKNAFLACSRTPFKRRKNRDFREMHSKKNCLQS